MLALHDCSASLGSDVVAILFTVGGDVVTCAIVQLTGPNVVPVALSFGWVASSFATLSRVICNGRIMPAPDEPAKLINVHSGISRISHSWVLGRLLRTLEHPLERRVALNISVHIVTADKPVSWDRCRITSLVAIAVQFVTAFIPYHLHDDYDVLLLTAMGTLLCLSASAIPHWRMEKYSARRDRAKVVALTGGNGSRTVAIVINPGYGVDLEDLAASQLPTFGCGATGLAEQKGSRVVSTAYALGLTSINRLSVGNSAGLWVQCICAASTCGWIAFLIAMGIFDAHRWYLFAVAAIGMLQNAFVANANRTPAAHGVPLELVEEFSREKVMHALMDAEVAYPGVGKVLLGEFFTTKAMNADEEEWWNGNRPSYDCKRKSETVVKYTPGENILVDRARQAFHNPKSLKKH